MASQSEMSISSCELSLRNEGSSKGWLFNTDCSGNGIPDWQPLEVRESAGAGGSCNSSEEMRWGRWVDEGLWRAAFPDIHETPSLLTDFMKKVPGSAICFRGVALSHEADKIFLWFPSQDPVREELSRHLCSCVSSVVDFCSSAKHWSRSRLSLAQQRVTDIQFPQIWGLSLIFSDTSVQLMSILKFSEKNMNSRLSGWWKYFLYVNRNIKCFKKFTGTGNKFCCWKLY